MSYFFSISCAIVFSLFLCLSPLTMGLWVLLLSVFVGGALALSVSSWMSMVLIIVYVGGLNVLFAYFIAILPNQYLFSYNLFMALLLMFSSSFLFYVLYPGYFKSRMDSLYFIIELFSKLDGIMLILLSIVLFLILISVVKLASRYEGALRPF